MAKIEKVIHEGVLPDGTFKNEPGAVVVNGSVRMSQKEGGCDVKKCKCSNGHWLSIVMPRTENGIVECISVTFDSQEEMNAFFVSREINL